MEGPLLGLNRSGIKSLQQFEDISDGVGVFGDHHSLGVRERRYNAVSMELHEFTQGLLEVIGLDIGKGFDVGGDGFTVLWKVLRLHDQGAFGTCLDGREVDALHELVPSWNEPIAVEE